MTEIRIRQITFVIKRLSKRIALSQNIGLPVMLTDMNIAPKLAPIISIKEPQLYPLLL